MGLLTKNKIIITLILASLIFRTILSTFPAFGYDQNSFRFWTIELANNGITNFYSSNFFTSNPIGFFYILWMNGLIISNLAPWVFNNTLLFDLILKFPANLADIFVGVFLYYLVKEKLGYNWGILTYTLYVFNPAIFFNSSIWGQYDGITALFLLLSIYLIIYRKSPEFSLISFSISWVLKPQTISFLPILGLLILFNSKPLRWSTSIVILLGILILIYLPFFPNNPVAGLIKVNFTSASLFDCTSCFAFNFWGIFGNWQKDSILIFNIPYLYWGIILYLFVLILIFFINFNKNVFRSPLIYLTTTVSIFSFFIFLTRMHERYVFPIFVFFLLGAVLLKSRFLLYLYFFVSFLHLLNLYIPYVYYNKELSIINSSVNDLSKYTQQLSLITTISYFILLIYFFKKHKI